jgi:hypothetical protein
MSTAAPRSPEATTIAPATFLAGRWTSPEVTEHWTAVDDALVGVGFTIEGPRTKSFEAMFIQERGGKLRFTAMPGGARSVAFQELDRGPERITFANPAHDFPKRVRYARKGDGVAARVEDDAHGFDFVYRSATPDRAPALEDADRAFRRDTAERGAEGWVAWLDRGGWMWREGAGRIQGAGAIRAAIEETLAHGTRKLAWEPVGSGVSPAGDMGFTVGRYTLTGVGQGASPEARGGYVTVWRAQPDGSWKALFHAHVPG